MSVLCGLVFVVSLWASERRDITSGFTDCGLWWNAINQHQNQTKHSPLALLSSANWEPFNWTGFCWRWDPSFPNYQWNYFSPCSRHVQRVLANLKVSCLLSRRSLRNPAVGPGSSESGYFCWFYPQQIISEWSYLREF